MSQLAEDFDVTTETVRKDLTELQRRGLVKRVHGGAVLMGTGGFEPLLSVRDRRNIEKKQRIAVATVRELPPGGTVIIDSGSTPACVAQRLPPDATLTVVTNSLVVAHTLTEHEHAQVVLLGGEVDKATSATVDAQTIRVVRELHVDALVLGADGISATGGLTTPTRIQAELKRAMVEAADRVIAVMDHSKVGIDQHITFAACREIDELITDVDVDDEAAGELETAGLTVIRV